MRRQSTQAPTNISATSGAATFNGEIVSTGDLPITERGFVYDIYHNHTVENDSKVTVANASVGTYFRNVTELLAGNTYYIRA